MQRNRSSLERLRALYRRLPLPPAVKVRISGLRWRLEQWGVLPGRAGPSQMPLQAPLALAPRSGKRDLVFFSIIDWHFRFQRPQQLATELAKQGHRVVYLSVNLVPSHEPGYAHQVVTHPEGGGPVWQIFLNCPGPLSVYTQAASEQQHALLVKSLAQVYEDLQLEQAVHVVQHPFWSRLALSFPTARVVYDCMDHHAGFHADGFVHDAAERMLMQHADLCVASAAAIEEALAPYARSLAVIRNAGEPDHFEAGVRKQASPVQAQQVGYYGAVADWFDLASLRAMASRFSEHQFHVVGDDTVGAARALKDLKNLHFYGEQPYAKLPEFLAQWDVCLIPFLRNELTRATNPVKIYEYLSAGKPVVATRLPELIPIAQEVPEAGLWLADAPDEFCEALGAAFTEAARSEEDRASRIKARQAYARGQSWAARAEAFSAALSGCDASAPRVSAIVVAYNQWPLTQRCLQSLTDASDDEALEILVIDNDSSDETPEQLKAWETEQRALGRPHRVLLQTQNLGFGGGVNVGLQAASGDYLVVLNNDLVLTPGWARGLRRHFERNPHLGLVCPTTNNIGNEAQVWLPGNHLNEVLASARSRTLRHAGQTIDLWVAAFFCVMMPRRVFETVGLLDEAFFPGYYEDDDYCYRVREAGFQIACAEDVFVYHELSASFNVDGAAKRQALLDRNRTLFESKWGPWKPHQYRPESLPPA